MTSISVRDETGQLITYEVIEGWTLMENLREYNVPIKAECGGACCCATCHVYVAPEWMARLPQTREDEEDMLDQAPNVQDNSRLSCQIVMNKDLDGLVIEVVPQE